MMKSATPIPLTRSRWIWFSFAGWFIGLVFMLASIDPVSKLKIEIFWIGASMSAGLGLMQWLAIRKLPHITINWLWFTIVGIGGVYLFFNVVYLFFNSLHVFDNLKTDNMVFIVPIASPFGGWLAGWLQHRYILAQISPTSKRWIWRSSLSWLACSIVIISYMEAAGVYGFHHYAIGKVMNTIIVLSGGPMIGWITGTTLVSILNEK
jgi:hypothetical protein